MPKKSSGSSTRRKAAGSVGASRRSARKSGRSSESAEARAESYQHPEAELASRPEIGTQAEFKRKKPARNYVYDSSLSPALDWDGQNAARERGEELIARITRAKSLDNAKRAAEELANLSRPFLNWSGKAERLSFDVPTLPLFVHERLSTQAILETKGYDPLREVKEAAADRWVNAVNIDGSFGKWRFRMANSVADVSYILDEDAALTKSALS